MKTQTTMLFAPITENEMSSLVKEVKETVANTSNHTTARNHFSAAGLWNIQRMKKARAQRRYMAF